MNIPSQGGKSRFADLFRRKANSPAKSEPVFFAGDWTADRRQALTQWKGLASSDGGAGSLELEAKSMRSAWASPKQPATAARRMSRGKRRKEFQELEGEAEPNKWNRDVQGGFRKSMGPIKGLKKLDPRRVAELREAVKRRASGETQKFASALESIVLAFAELAEENGPWFLEDSGFGWWVDASMSEEVTRQVETDEWQASRAASAALSLVFGLAETPVHYWGIGDILNLEALDSMKMFRLSRVTGVVLKEGEAELKVTSIEFICADCGVVIPGTGNENLSRFNPSIESLTENSRENSTNSLGGCTPPRKCPTSNCPGRMFSPLRQTARCTVVQKIVIQNFCEGRKQPTFRTIELRTPFTSVVTRGDAIELMGRLRPLRTERTDGFGKTHEAGLFTCVFEAHSVRPSPAPPLPDLAAPPGLRFAAVVGSMKAFSGTASTAATAVITLMMITEGHPSLLLLDPNDSALPLVSMATNLANKIICPDLPNIFPVEKGENGVLEPGRILMAGDGLCVIPTVSSLGRPELLRLLGAIESRKLLMKEMGNFSAKEFSALLICIAKTVSRRFETVQSELGLPRGTLSKFDLVINAKGNSDQMQVAYARKLLRQAGFDLSGQSSIAEGVNFSKGFDVFSQPFTTRLFAQIEELNENSALLSTEDLRLFIAEVRNYSTPTIPKEVLQLLGEFVLQIEPRNPFGFRLLEILTHFVIARSRFEHAEVVEPSHAEEVAQMFDEILTELCDNSPVEPLVPLKNKKDATPASLSMPKKMKLFVGQLKVLAGQRDSNLFSLDELRELAENLALEIDDFSMFVDRLNAEAVLIKKPNSFYELSNSL